MLFIKPPVRKIGAGSQNQDSGGGTLMVRWVLWRGLLKCRDESRVHPKGRDESGVRKPTRTRTRTKTGSPNIQDYKQRSDKGDERVVRIYRVVWWAAAGVDDDRWLVDQRWCVGTPTHTHTLTHITTSMRRAGSMGLMNRDSTPPPPPLGPPYLSIVIIDKGVIQDVSSRHPTSLLWTVTFPVHQVLKSASPPSWVQNTIDRIRGFPVYELWRGGGEPGLVD